MRLPPSRFVSAVRAGIRAARIPPVRAPITITGSALELRKEFAIECALSPQQAYARLQSVVEPEPVWRFLPGECAFEGELDHANGFRFDIRVMPFGDVSYPYMRGQLVPVSAGTRIVGAIGVASGRPRYIALATLTVCLLLGFATAPFIARYFGHYSVALATAGWFLAAWLLAAADFAWDSDFSLRRLAEAFA